MPKVTQEHLDSRRQQIMDAAIECFSREGFHRATMQDIVQQSGLSPGAIYLYFKSKDEIIAAIADERHARERELIAATQKQGKQGVPWRNLIRDFFSPLADPQEQRRRRLGIQLWAEALRNPEVLPLIRRGVNVPRKMLAELIVKAQQKGELSHDLDPDALARAVIALFQGFILQQAWDRNADLDAYIKVIESMIQALSPRPPKTPPPKKQKKKT